MQIRRALRSPHGMACCVIGLGAALIATEARAARSDAAGEAPEDGLAAVQGVGGRSGHVEGTVTVNARPEPPPPRLSPYSRRRYAPAAPAADPAATSQAVVFIRVPPESVSPPTAAARIVQRNLTILPRLTVIQAGTRVDFPNEDDVFHNLFSLSSPTPFNLGRYEPGTSVSMVFEQAGLLRMFCDIHPDMDGSILILDTPFFTMPDARGGYRIEDVPEGTHTLVLWHETAGSDSTEVVVRDGAVTRADLRLGSP